MDEQNSNLEQAPTEPTVQPPVSQPQVISTPPTTPPKPAGSQKRLLMIIVGVVVALVIGGVVFTALNRDKSSQDAVNDLLNSEDKKEFTSTEHGFSIQFPGFPDISRETLDIEGRQVPMTTYIKEVNNGNTAFTVGVVNYPTEFDFSTEATQKSSLEGSLNGSAQSINGEITASELKTHLGMPAITGTIHGSHQGTEFDYYTLNFLRDNSLYQIATVNAAKADFDEFVNSFKLK